MKNFFMVLILLLAMIFICSPQISFADDPVVREIMEKVGERKGGDDSVSHLEMTLIDKNGKKRVRQFVSYSKKIKEDIMSVSFFQHPPDVRGTGFLTQVYGNSDKEDEQWLFLPSIGKTRRIASSGSSGKSKDKGKGKSKGKGSNKGKNEKKGGKSGSFMGSDFSYADLSSRKNDEFDLTFHKRKEIVVDGKKCWLIWSTPRNQATIYSTGYTKSLLFVQQDIHFIIRIKNYMQEGGYIKYLNVKKLKMIDDLLVATEVHMTKKLGKKTVHKTIIKTLSKKFNQNLSDDLFTIRRLERGL